MRSLLNSLQPASKRLPEVAVPPLESVEAVLSNQTPSRSEQEQTEALRQQISDQRRHIERLELRNAELEILVNAGLQQARGEHHAQMEIELDVVKRSLAASKLTAESALADAERARVAAKDVRISLEDERTKAGALEKALAESKATNDAFKDQLSHCQSTSIPDKNEGMVVLEQPGEQVAAGAHTGRAKGTELPEASRQDHRVVPETVDGSVARPEEQIAAGEESNGSSANSVRNDLAPARDEGSAPPANMAFQVAGESIVEPDAKMHLPEGKFSKLRTESDGANRQLLFNRDEIVALGTQSLEKGAENDLLRKQIPENKMSSWAQPNESPDIPVHKPAEAPEQSFASADHALGEQRGTELIEPKKMQADLAPEQHRSASGNEKWLIGRADYLIKQGEISGARLLLEKALNEGSPKAAFRLAETYDSRVLASWKAHGTIGDQEKARQLYGRALAGGIQEAKGRL